MTQHEYIVTNCRTGESVTKHTMKAEADDACRVCNDHLKRSGQVPTYQVIVKEKKK